ncbi:MAG: methylenetetrahydrofolate reductase [Pseudomonadota bacterium]
MKSHAAPSHTGSFSTELKRFVESYSLEVLPQAADGLVADGVIPTGRDIYLPAIPGSDPAIAVDACRRLAQAGYVPIPHLSARTISGPDDLKQRLAAFATAGAEGLLLIAGDAKQAKGPYFDTLAILESGLLADYGFTKLGIAGHPEGHTAASERDVVRALQTKLDYAKATGTDMWMVSQFSFSAPAIVDWLNWLRRHEFDVPVRIGVAGPASIRKLLTFAMRCGVGNSARFLTQKPRNVASLVRKWDPGDLLQALLADSAVLGNEQVAGVHFFPFGGIADVKAWIDSIG